jgi:xanthine permease
MNNNVSKDNVYKLEGRVPLQEAIPLGMQHVLAMYAGNLTPLLIVAGVVGMSTSNLTILLQNAMFCSGVVTIIQLYRLWKIGSGLPTVMGTSSGFIPVGISVGAGFGYGAVMGASLIGGILEFLLGFVIKPLRKILPHVVTGTVVTTLGISLIGVGIQFVAGGVGQQSNPEYGSFKNLGVGLFVFLVIIILNQSKNRLVKMSAILLGIIAGYILAVILGMVDFTAVKEASWIGFPRPIFMIEGIGYEFKIEAIIPFILVYLATTVETIGDNTGIAMGGLGRDITDDELQGAVHADGFGSAFASLFACMPNTSFSQNVGLVGLTKVVNRFTIMTGAVFLVLCSFIPKLGALVSTIPNPVLGGGVVLMFAMISMSGLDLLYEKGTISGRNSLIVAASLAVAFGLSNSSLQVMRYLPTVVQSIFGQAIVGAFVTATILNLILPGRFELPSEEVAK